MHKQKIKLRVSSTRTNELIDDMIIWDLVISDLVTIKTAIGKSGAKLGDHSQGGC